MLKDDLYTIQKITDENNIVEATILLNEQHEIFKGHFPGQPVLPGACMLQMIKEILVIVFGKNLELIKADEIKFLRMIVPDESVLHFSIQHSLDENNNLKVVAQVIVNDVICCKMKAAIKSSVQGSDTTKMP